MTSKEAVLELICEAKSVNIDEGRICFLRKIIEKDLERLEKLEKENQELIKKTDCCMWHECNKISQENAKLKKTFDILKNKKVNIFHIWVFEYYEQYKEHYQFSEYNAEEDMLSFEEFDLLKGILNDEQ